MTQNESYNDTLVNSSSYQIPESELRYYEAHADFLDHAEGIELELAREDQKETNRINQLPNGGALKSRFAEFAERREIQERVEKALAEIVLSNITTVE